MIWNSPEAFFEMGGYALYVWGSLGACVLTLAVEILLVRQRKRAILKTLQRARHADLIEAEGNAI